VVSDVLEREWGVRRGTASLDQVMRFGAEGLVLGAGTVLWPSNPPVQGEEFERLERRLRALLAAAHLRPVALSGLAHVQKALVWRESGEDALAAMHLALSGLDRLGRPAQDAKRLFLADQLLTAGLDTATLLRALDVRSLPPTLAKYDPDQQRVPSGSGLTSGQWTDEATSPSNPTIEAPNVRPSLHAEEVSTSDSPQAAGQQALPRPGSGAV
jgi:hypothetical protein